MVSVALTCMLIILARIADVSLGTIRTIVVVQGRRGLAFVLGFFELLIWVSIVSRVILHLEEKPVYAVAYALGFALGNYIGMTIESRIALGRQVVRIITRQGAALATALRDIGLRVTQFPGYGRDGPVEELFVEVERRAVTNVINLARSGDPKCYYMVDDVRLASSSAVRLAQPTGWRAVFKRK
mgnify:CR=1 FL=1